MPVRTAHAPAPASPRPIWQTEQGISYAQVGVLWPRFASRWASLMHFAQNVLTKERLHVGTSPYWYDRNHGFGAFPEYMIGATGIGPQMLPVRTMQAELFGKTMIKELDFGHYGNEQYVGAKWRAANGGGTIGICAASFGATDINIAVSSGTNFTYVDPWGNTSVLTASGGKVIFPAHELPGWLHIPAGIEADLVPADWAWGINHVPQAVPSATGNQVNVHRLVDEYIFNQFDTDTSSLTAYGAPYNDNTGTLPQTIRWDLRRTITLDRLVLHSMMPWQNSGPIVDFDLDTSVDGTTWTTRYTHAQPALATPWTGVTSFDRFWDEQHIFDVAFTAASVRYVRVVVRNAANGGHLSTAESLSVWGQAYPPTVIIRGLRAFWTAGKNPDVGTIVYANPTDMHGLVGWYDASDASSIASTSGKVTQWNDKSGHGRHLVQTTDANRPTTGSTINGVAALTFNGTSQYLTYPGFVAGIGYLIRTVVFVAINADHAANHQVVWWDTNSLGGLVLNGGPLTCQAGNDGPGAAASVATETAGTGFIGSARIDGKNTKLGINSTITSGLSIGSHQNMSALNVGFTPAGAGTWMKGQIGAVLIFRDVLSDSALATVMAPLKTQWGTP